MKPHPKICKAAARLGLTPRETELVEMFAMGYSTTAVSKRLDISESTLRTHLRNVYAELRIESRAELVALVLAHVLGISQKDMPKNRKQTRGRSSSARTAPARKAARKKPIKRKKSAKRKTRRKKPSATSSRKKKKKKSTRRR